MPTSLTGTTVQKNRPLGQPLSSSSICGQLEFDACSTGVLVEPEVTAGGVVAAALEDAAPASLAGLATRPSAVKVLPSSPISRIVLAASATAFSSVGSFSVPLLRAA